MMCIYCISFLSFTTSTHSMFPTTLSMVESISTHQTLIQTHPMSYPLTLTSKSSCPNTIVLNTINVQQYNPQPNVYQRMPKTDATLYHINESTNYHRIDAIKLISNNTIV
jgi:hypothetical protein